jgi:hypothetical protein
VSRLVDAEFGSCRFATKPAETYEKGSGVLARQRPGLTLEVSSARTAHHDTAHLVLTSASLQVVSTRRTTTAHKHHPFTIPLLPPPNNNPIHNTNTPAPWSQLALPNASTDQPLYAHRDSIKIQSTAPSQLFRKLRHRCTASPAVPPTQSVRPATSCSALPFPRRFRPCTRIAYCCSLGHVSTNTDDANDAPRLGWAWTPDVPHSRRRLTSALWTTRAALELKSLPT